MGARAEYGGEGVLASRLGPRPEGQDLLALVLGVVAGVDDAVDRAQRHTEAAVDAVVEGDGEPAEEVVGNLVDRVDLAWAGIFARTAADAGLLDDEMAGSAWHQTVCGKVVSSRAEALTNTWSDWLKRKNMSRPRGSGDQHRNGVPGSDR